MAHVDHHPGQPLAEDQPSGSATVIRGAAGSDTAATAVCADVGGGHTTAFGATCSRVVSTTPGSEDSGASVVVVADEVVVLVIEADVAASVGGSAVPSLLRAHAATLGAVSSTPVRTAHTSRFTAPVWREPQSLANAAASSRSTSTYGVPETSTTTLAIVPPVKG